MRAAEGEIESLEFCAKFGYHPSTKNCLRIATRPLATGVAIDVPLFIVKLLCSVDLTDFSVGDPPAALYSDVPGSEMSGLIEL